jgi:hypothetical protein
MTLNRLLFPSVSCLPCLSAIGFMRPYIVECDNRMTRELLVALNFISRLREKAEISIKDPLWLASFSVPHTYVEWNAVLRLMQINHHRLHHFSISNLPHHFQAIQKVRKRMKRLWFIHNRISGDAEWLHWLYSLVRLFRTLRTSISSNLRDSTQVMYLR